MGVTEPFVIEQGDGLAAGQSWHLPYLGRGTLNRDQCSEIERAVFKQIQQIQLYWAVEAVRAVQAQRSKNPKRLNQVGKRLGARTRSRGIVDYPVPDMPGMRAHISCA